MLLGSILALAFFRAKPRILAVQRWDVSKRIEAWTPDGKRLPSTLSITYGDAGLPDRPGETEVVAAIPCSPGSEPPDAYWSDIHGLGPRTSWSEGWKNDDPKSGFWLFSELGFADAKEAAGVLQVASGPWRVVSPTTKLKLNTWTNLGHGFRARIENRFFKGEDGDRVKSALLDVRLPLDYETWDFHPVLKSGAVEMSMVQFDSPKGKLHFRYEKGVKLPANLTLSARPYVSYPFKHIQLRPR